MVTRDRDLTGLPLRAERPGGVHGPRDNDLNDGFVMKPRGAFLQEGRAASETHPRSGALPSDGVNTSFLNGRPEQGCGEWNPIALAISMHFDPGQPVPRLPDRLR